jgi:hypothetical protein
MLEFFGADRAISSGFMSRARNVLLAVIGQSPEAVWHQIARFLGPPIDDRAFDLGRWLHGEYSFDQSGHGALELFPPDLIWQWVDEDIQERAWRIADIVPKALFHSAEKTCLAREVLVRYGDSEDVRNELSNNIYSGGWSGPASLHYEDVKRNMIEFLNEETDPRVRSWVGEFIERLDATIEFERGREERGW